MIMVKLIEKSINNQLNILEYSLFNFLRETICKTGILDHELSIVQQQFGKDDQSLIMVNEQMMASAVDKIVQQEKLNNA